MFPLAVVVAESENKSSWIWFLENLVSALGRCSGMVFISDRQKGLLEAVKKVAPANEHRFCMRHFYANFKLGGFKGKDEKDAIWGAACAYTQQGFQEKMDELKALNEAVHKWMLDQNAQNWARWQFSGLAKSAVIVNNLAKSFNEMIMVARDKPIVTMLEMIKRQFMVRFQERLQYVQKFKGPLCPSIHKNLRGIKKWARGCQCLYSRGRLFEVFNELKTYLVDLDNCTCTCRRWDLRGIPCIHGVAAIYTDKGKPENYVHEFYHTAPTLGLGTDRSTLFLISQCGYK
ncbi:uncharacterized protein LOC131326282 isoform X1 [Rhododendron vialii]|uniref:uncharacterized protein LOC131326282 isoform X1 n=1 Tax=Rhododendron vialii TaxID=182163 RepID=UPI00265EC2E2|nr:uncharacterized protein LOC131326282 isoform X1 [Rhododendron vialii]XP_058214990.1 uncharacterized protein LOC131326282 isoform X1 [Rhododendron vialii]